MNPVRCPLAYKALERSRPAQPQRIMGGLNSGNDKHSIDVARHIMRYGILRGHGVAYRSALLHLCKPLLPTGNLIVDVFF